MIENKSSIAKIYKRKLNLWAMNKNLFVSFLLLNLFFVSCKILRKPEEPLLDSAWEYPDNINSLLSNFQNGFVSRNVDIYMSCFDSLYFKFYPDPSIMNSPEGELYKDWGYEIEREVVVNLFNAVDLGAIVPISLHIEFTQFDTTSLSGTCYFDYSVDIVFVDGEKKAKGSGYFKVKRNADNLWYIVEWRDFKKGDTLSWAELKVNFR